MQLTSKDIELARRYLVLRTAIKGLTLDKQEISEGLFELGISYTKLLEDALVRANDELRQIHKYPLEIKKTDQPTVYEVKIGTRRGYIEINVVEITGEISDIINGT